MSDGLIIALVIIALVVIIIISIIAAFLTNFQDIPVVQHALSGIRISVCVLMSVSIYKLAKKGVKNIFGAVLCIAGFVFSYFTNVSIVLLVIVAGILGVIEGRMAR